MKTIKQLLKEHNDFANDFDDVIPLKSWKRSAVLLVERIAKLRARPRPKPVAAKQPAMSIRDFVEGMLIETNGALHHRTQKPLGHTYEHILVETRKAYPEAETSVACLRWYATHLNRRTDVHMPQRPRAKAGEAAR